MTDGKVIGETSCLSPGLPYLSLALFEAQANVPPAQSITFSQRVVIQIFNGLVPALFDK
jgi:hypothetical protein